MCLLFVFTYIYIYIYKDILVQGQKRYILHLLYREAMFLFQMQVMEKDLAELGYIMEWGKVDAKDLLLPQRRNRIYATADVNSGQEASLYAQAMRATMESLKSDVTFCINDILDPSICHETALTARAQKQVDAAIEQACLKGHTSDIFIDISTSSSRLPEYAIGCTTCIRPSGGIYASSLRRCLVPEELWKCQGIWVNEFANPEAARSMLEMGADAKDLCGNAFASTSCQAKLICSLVNSLGWDLISGHPISKALVATTEDTEESITKLQPSDEISSIGSGCLEDIPRDACGNETPVVKRRRLTQDGAIDLDPTPPRFTRPGSFTRPGNSPRPSSCIRPSGSAMKTHASKRKQESRSEGVKASGGPAPKRSKRKQESRSEGVKASGGPTPKRLCFDLDNLDVETQGGGRSSCIGEASGSSQHPALGSQQVLKRCRKKTSVPEGALAVPAKASKPGRQVMRDTCIRKRKYAEKPDTIRSGKNSVLPIATKLRLLKEAWFSYIYFYFFKHCRYIYIFLNTSS